MAAAGHSAPNSIVTIEPRFEIFKGLPIAIFESDASGTGTAYKKLLTYFRLPPIERLCGPFVDKGFGEESYTQAQIIVVAFDVDKKTGSRTGVRTIMNVKKNFLSWEPSQDTPAGYLYIDLICSAEKKKLPSKLSPSGRLLIEWLIDYMQENNYKGIGLRALSNVIGYYERLGWKLGLTSCLRKDLRTSSRIQSKLNTYLGQLKTLKNSVEDLDNNSHAQSILKKIEQKLSPRRNQTFLTNMLNTKMLVENEGANNLSTLVTSQRKLRSDGYPMLLCNDAYSEMDTTVGGNKKKKKRRRRTSKRKVKKTKRSKKTKKNHRKKK